MSYTPKQQSSGGTGGQSSQQAKALAGITQQMQNLVHGQNALPQAAQAGLGAFANLNMTLQQHQQQQRIESIFREQQLLFSANSQFQQHFQQQMQQNAAKEPLALTRSPADLLNKIQHHQQQANGSATATSIASNLTNQQLQQQLQAFSQNPANLMQQLQAYQYQMQQQNKQKMLSLNQASQSLTSLQAQTVAQQHMQQIQQTLQQQQQKLMASHSKTLAAGNQAKTAVSSNSQTSSPPLPSNNNLPNKQSGKLCAGPSNQQSKPMNTSQSSPKSVSNPSSNKNSGHALGTQKPSASPQMGIKSPSPKLQINAVPLTKCSNKPPTPPIKPATIVSQSPPKSCSSPSSSPKPINISFTTAKPSSTDSSTKNTPSLSIALSQVTSITTPTVTPPKPCTSPVAPVVPAASVVSTPVQQEQKKLEEPKQVEEPVVKNAEIEDAKEENVKEVETGKEVVEKVESAREEEKDKETQEKGNQISEKTDSSERDESKSEENTDSSISSEVPSTEVSTTETSTSESPNKSEPPMENSPQKASVKSKQSQRKNSKAEASLSEPIQKEQPAKVEKKKVSPAKEECGEDKATKTSVLETPNKNEERRSQRHRLKTILYQSPLPELAFIAKLSASEASSSPRNYEEKLTIFYKNEYLAVRNSEGGFFLCQALQNVYKSSPRIRIRWLSEEKKDSNVYIPDFYDNTDIECVLTTVEMERINKHSFRLPQSERGRIENILKKAIDVEKGVLPRPDVTEENPDGLDISLYKNESQIEKKTPVRKRKLSLSHSVKKSHTKPKSPKKKKKSKPKKERGSSDSYEESDEEETDNDKEYKPSQKKNLVTQPKLRAQRSPLARARAASPITIRKELLPRTRKSVPQESPNTGKNEENNEVTSPMLSRSDRAKRRGIEAITNHNQIQEEIPAKKPALAATQNKKTETKTSNKAKTNKSDDDLLIIQESKNSFETSGAAIKSCPTKAEASETLSNTKTSKAASNPSVGPKKNKVAASPESSTASSQSAAGGRSTRSRK